MKERLDFTFTPGGYSSHSHSLGYLEFKEGSSNRGHRSDGRKRRLDHLKSEAGHSWIRIQPRLRIPPKPYHQPARDRVLRRCRRIFVYNASDERVLTFDCAANVCVNGTAVETWSLRGMGGRVLRELSDVLRGLLGSR